MQITVKELQLILFSSCFQAITKAMEDPDTGIVARSELFHPELDGAIKLLAVDTAVGRVGKLEVAAKLHQILDDFYAKVWANVLAQLPFVLPEVRSKILEAIENLTWRHLDRGLEMIWRMIDMINNNCL